ncbi:hypothetical protein [Sphingomonas desiccabilis]|uniref:Glycerophosphoryl diester phosphodiesterase membrane domain-containing protein n=1 Tax=Sphingomonas desiccabilis TaxID=429134 RepID=A0A4Q2IT08_9SPHN|nr:hypothetical protein [Sphingomonas desiccabilis]MBB3911792.1 hypothetical protein [Sphingomonas desiccabilis]RXZ31488.1 hypothetical protein EO081_09590 [Sphingomonas desiccabilis]
MSELCAEAIALAAGGWWIAGGAILLLSGAGIAADLLGPAGRLAGAAVKLGVSWGILRYMAQRRGWIAPGSRAGGVLGLIGLNILYSVGVGLACLLLLLPGLYVAARWSAASVILVAERASPSEALGESWTRTRDWSGAIALVLCGVFLPLVAAGVALALWTDPDTTSLGPVAGTNLAIALSYVCAWYVGMAAYARTRASQEGLEQVFA